MQPYTTIARIPPLNFLHFTGFFLIFLANPCTGTRGRDFDRSSGNGWTCTFFSASLLFHLIFLIVASSTLPSSHSAMPVYHHHCPPLALLLCFTPHIIAYDNDTTLRTFFIDHSPLLSYPFFPFTHTFIVLPYWFPPLTTSTLRAMWFMVCYMPMFSCLLSCITPYALVVSFFCLFARFPNFCRFQARFYHHCLLVVAAIDYCQTTVGIYYSRYPATSVVNTSVRTRGG